MKHLVSTMVLSSLMLVGCGYPTDSVIEDAKDNLQTDVQIEYEESFEENFRGLMDDLASYYDLTGYSLENRVIVLSETSTYSDYEFLVTPSPYFEDDKTPCEFFEVDSIQREMSYYNLHDVTVYVEYFHDNGEQYALLTVTSEEYSIEEVK